MKNIITLFLLIVTLNSLYSQHKIVANYGVRVLEQSFKDGMPESIRGYAERMDDEVITLEYSLIADKNTSVWELKNRHGYGEYHLGSVYAGNAVYYRDITAGLYIEQHLFLDNFFITDFSSKIKPWNVTQEKEEINGYICYKVTTTIALEAKDSIIEKPITAWYCPELQYRYGPKEFGGLPGLIVELIDGGLCYYITDVNISSKNACLAIEKPVQGKKVTYSELIKEQEKLSGEMITRFKQ